MDNKTNLRQKHYNRMEGFLRYDIELRDLEEQKIILEEVQKVAKDMLKELETK